MKRVFKANTYFLIILLLQLFLPMNIVFQFFNINDIRIMLLLNHTIIFIVPAIIYLFTTRQSARAVLKLNKLYLQDGLLIALLAFVCQPIMMFFSLISQFFFENQIGDFVTEIVNTPYIILMLLIAVLPSITEEITIRGIVLSGYEDKNIFVACGVTGLLFGIMHLDPQQFLYATVLGFILAYIVRITNSIFAGSLLHFIINGTSVTIQKIASKIPENLETINEVAEISLKKLPLTDKVSISVVYGILAILFAFLAYKIVTKIKNNNIRRGIIRTEDASLRGITNCDIKKDNIFNLPLVMIISIYVLLMIWQIFLR